VILQAFKIDVSLALLAWDCGLDDVGCMEDVGHSRRRFLELAVKEVVAV
jgi:hypothetical protein